MTILLHWPLMWWSCGMKCCGELWCGVRWCGVVWCGVVIQPNGVVCRVVWCGATYSVHISMPSQSWLEAHTYTLHMGQTIKGNYFIKQILGLINVAKKTPSYTAFLSDTIVQAIYAVSYLWIIVSHSISWYAIVHTTATFEHLSQYVKLYYIILYHSILYCTTLSYYTLVYEYTCVI